MSKARPIYCAFCCKSEYDKKIAGVFTSLKKSADFCNQRFVIQRAHPANAKIMRMEIIVPEENSTFSPNTQLPIAWLSFGQIDSNRPRWGGKDADKWDKNLQALLKKKK